MKNGLCMPGEQRNTDETENQAILKKGPPAAPLCRRGEIRKDYMMASALKRKRNTVGTKNQAILKRNGGEGRGA